MKQVQFLPKSKRPPTMGGFGLRGKISAMSTYFKLKWSGSHVQSCYQFEWRQLFAEIELHFSRAECLDAVAGHRLQCSPARLGLEVAPRPRYHGHCRPRVQKQPFFSRFVKQPWSPVRICSDLAELSLSVPSSLLGNKGIRVINIKIQCIVIK